MTTLNIIILVKFIEIFLSKQLNDIFVFTKMQRNDRDSDDTHFSLKQYAAYTTAAATVACAAVVGFAAYRYKVAKPSEYLVRTGLLIDTVAVDKKAFQLPFQTAKFISVQPTNYKFDLQAMSKEKMEFILPGVYTIGPKDDKEVLKRYATLMSNKNEAECTAIIKGIIEGETRVLTASLTLEEIFSGRDAFRDNVTTRIDKELAKIGFGIHNANIQEMSDHEGSEYFQFLRQRARANAENDARMNIAEAQKEGDIAVKEREKDTRMKTREFEATAVTFENERNMEIARSTADLKIKEAEYYRESQLAEIEAHKAAEIRDAELQKELEQRNVLQQIERLRSEQLTQAIVQAEARERDADAYLYTKEKEAEAEKRKADAYIYQKQKEAEGIRAVLDAQAEGLNNLLQTTDDPQIILQYMMIDRQVYPELARANADAIRGLEPKITYWKTGGGDGPGDNPITNIIQNIPPLMETIHSQTGILPPDWMMNTKGMVKKQ